jgi:preprotein translocase subunit YajC
VILPGAAAKAEGFLLFPEDFVLIAISKLSLLAQGEAAPAQPPSTIVSILNNPLTPLVGLFFLFYFIFILPEKRRKAQEASMMSALKKNDRVVTAGGIHGTIVAAPAEGGVVTIRIDENSNTRIKINRSAIAKVISDKEGQETKHKETVSDTKDK